MMTQHQMDLWHKVSATVAGESDQDIATVAMNMMAACIVYSTSTICEAQNVADAIAQQLTEAVAAGYRHKDENTLSKGNRKALQ